MEEAVIVRAGRTPICRQNKDLKDFQVHELLVPLLQKIGGDVATLIDDVMISNAVTPGGNVARMAVLAAGFPESIPGLTIDRQCSGGLDTVRLAASLIESGAGTCYLVGAVESASTLKRPRAHFTPREDGDPDMPAAAEHAARHWHISRAEQDGYTVRTYNRAWRAHEAGFFQQEIISVGQCSADEAFERRRPIEQLVNRARPLEVAGTVTAANSCGIHDGAAVLLIMSRTLARKLSLRPSLIVIDGAAVGFSPQFPVFGPYRAISALLARRHNFQLADVAYVEIIEAFAVKMVLTMKMLDLPETKVNIHGGALTLGHPYSASGLILLVHLFYQARKSPFSYGIAASGSGGGVGSALLVNGMK
ncbi:acetyl-CoA C-acyltransferase [Sporolactobacillus terrae]|uniref:acetyl-CoA C-acyltransferase n=1 Tax=Sporolactobacillus terrae TaxID=269673 RepID=UPI00048DAFE0|nr:acetyl-CoA C-acyltransferase [Sporolactobacillus terrae]